MTKSEIVAEFERRGLTDFRVIWSSPEAMMSYPTSDHHALMEQFMSDYLEGKSKPSKFDDSPLAKEHHEH